MQALKSQLAKRIQQAGIRIPLCPQGSKFVFEGKEYTVKYVPRVSS
jgi:hypothetical protein